MPTAFSLKIAPASIKEAQHKKFLGLVPRIFFTSSLFTLLLPLRNFFGGNK